MLIQKRNFLILALWLCCATMGFAQRTALNATESAALKARITENTKSLRSLQGDFTQTRRLSYMDDDMRTTGKLYFKAPDRIRWEYVTPKPYVIIFDDQNMYTVENGRTKTTKLVANRRMQGLNDLLAGSLRGGDLLDEGRFTISYFREQNNYTAILAPKDKGLSRYVRQVELAFDGTSLLLTTVTLTDPAGDSTRLAFTNQRKDEPVADSIFQP